jgi:hypothetical protein
VVAAVALWAIVSVVICLFVGTPAHAACYHGIGNAINDPHAWDAYCATVDAEWLASLTIVDRLTQFPAIWVVLFFGGIALAVVGSALLRRAKVPVPA